MNAAVISDSQQKLRINLANNVSPTSKTVNEFLPSVTSPVFSFLSPTDNDEIVNMRSTSVKSGTSCGFDDDKPDLEECYRFLYLC